MCEVSCAPPVPLGHYCRTRSRMSIESLESLQSTEPTSHTCTSRRRRKAVTLTRPHSSPRIALLRLALGAQASAHGARRPRPRRAAVSIARVMDRTYGRQPGHLLLAASCTLFAPLPRASPATSAFLILFLSMMCVLHVARAVAYSLDRRLLCALTRQRVELRG